MGLLLLILAVVLIVWGVVSLVRGAALMGVALLVVGLIILVSTGTLA